MILVYSQACKPQFYSFYFLAPDHDSCTLGLHNEALRRPEKGLPTVSKEAFSPSQLEPAWCGLLGDSHLPIQNNDLTDVMTPINHVNNPSKRLLANLSVSVASHCDPDI